MLGGKTSDAAVEFVQMFRLEPDLPAKLLQEGRRLSSQGQLNAALVRFNTALWLQPDSPAALNEVAWILATHPTPQFRNGARAATGSARARIKRRRRSPLLGRPGRGLRGIGTVS
jgi:hypothetical protein